MLVTNLPKKSRRGTPRGNLSYLYDWRLTNIPFIQNYHHLPIHAYIFRQLPHPTVRGKKAIGTRERLQNSASRPFLSSGVRRNMQPPPGRPQGPPLSARRPAARGARGLPETRAAHNAGGERHTVAREEVAPALCRLLSRSVPGRRAERALPGLPTQRLRDFPFLLPAPTEETCSHPRDQGPASLLLREPAESRGRSLPGARVSAVLGYTSTA